MQGNYKDAEHWYRLVLTFDPHFAIAYMNLTSIYASTGRLAEAEICRDQAYRNQRVFIEHEGDPIRRVLVLCVGRTSGYIPFEILLPTTTCTRIKYVIDYAPEWKTNGCPNTIWYLMPSANPISPACLQTGCNASSVVAPARYSTRRKLVTLTQRHRLAAFMGDIEEVVNMPCIRLDGTAKLAGGAGLSIGTERVDLPYSDPPCRISWRQAIRACETMEQLELQIRAINDICYLTSLCEYVSADGYSANTASSM